MSEEELRKFVNSNITQKDSEKEEYLKSLQYLQEDANVQSMKNAVNSDNNEEKVRLRAFLNLADTARLTLNNDDYNKYHKYVKRNLTNEDREKASEVIKNVENVFAAQDEALSRKIDAILTEIDKDKKFDSIDLIDSLSNTILDKQVKAKYRSLYLIYKADFIKEKNIYAAYDFLNAATDYIKVIENYEVSSELRIKQAAVRRMLDKIKSARPDLPKDDQTIDKINKLLDKAEKDLDKKALEEARKLIENLPNGHEKEELTKRLNAISDKIIEKEITDLLDKAEKDLDKSALDKAKDLISKLPNGDKKNAFEKKADEIDKLIKEKDGKDPNGGSDSDDKDDPKPEQPTIEENAPKKTWKTYVSLAAGIGVGAAVFFTCGTVGVSVMAIAGGITKRLLAKRRRKLELQRLKGELPIEEVEEPLPGIKGKIQKLKNYFKSEEFCRDANWFLNGAIYTGLGLNIASSIYNLASAKFGAGVDTTPTPDTVTTDVQPKLDPTTATNSDPMSGIKIGENVGDYNVSVGHDTASWATSGSHTENLISEYVNSGSVFKRFAVMNPDGTVGQMINTNGLSIADFCNQSGIDPSQIAVDVASKNGTSQAWVSVSELVKGVGGKSLW